MKNENERDFELHTQLLRVTLERQHKVKMEKRVYPSIPPWAT